MMLIPLMKFKTSFHSIREFGVLRRIQQSDAAVLTGVLQLEQQEGKPQKTQRQGQPVEMK